MEFEGDFETHITVRADDRNGVVTLRAWADRHGLRFHHIVLARGHHPSQPMVSVRGGGGLSHVRRTAERLVTDLSTDGFTVTRIKIEAAVENRDVPVADSEASQHVGRYFEHHVKLLLEPAADMTPLTELAVRHAAHLSRNARRVRVDGREERFVTQRCHCVGRVTAKLRFNELMNELNLNAYVIVSAEREYVVLDRAFFTAGGMGGIPVGAGSWIASLVRWNNNY